MITAMIDLLAIAYQSGNPGQMQAIARSMLAAIPNDIVALQFLGLALYQMGHFDAAFRVFRRVAAGPDDPEIPVAETLTTSETAASITLREATRPGSQLADGWRRIAGLLRGYGYHQPARQARNA